MRLPFMRSRSAVGGAKRSAPDTDDPGSLQTLRTQARRRLLGAVVLLVAAVAGFPLLFETQPRPLPGQAGAEATAVLIRADNTSRNNTADAAAVAAAAVRSAATARPASTPSTVVADAAERLPAAAEKPVLAASAPASVAAGPTAQTAQTARKPQNTAVATAATPDPAASAPGTEPAARWVVQVGAYNELERMRQARQKAEKLGFKTYITEVDSPTGKRTRVRLGPFATKKEAEAAAAKVKTNGMAANVLGL